MEVQEEVSTKSHEMKPQLVSVRVISWIVLSQE